MALLDEINTLEQNELAQQQNRNTGTLSDVIDLGQSGAYGAVSGMAEFVGAENVADYFKGKQEEQFETLTPEMSEAMAKRFVNDDLSLGEGLTDWRSWVGQGAVLAGQMIPSLIPGGAAARGASAVGAGVRGVAAAGMATNAAANAAIAGGMQGQAVESDILNMPFEDLAGENGSSLFRQKVAEYANQDLPATEVLERARQDVATQASEQVMSDPTLIGINAVGGMLGDKAMTKLVAGNLGKTIRGNIAKGIVSEGVTEAGQGGFGQYVSNVAKGDAGFEVDLMDGVYAAALEEGIIAGGLGGAAGAVGGAQQRVQNLDRVVDARRKIEGVIGQPAEELLASGYDREKAKSTIQQMAENAAIKMGFDANEAADIATQSVNAAVGDAPGIDEQVANVETKTNDYMNRSPEERKALVGQLLGGVIANQDIGEGADRRTPANLAYQMGGRTQRMQQAAQTARAGNVPFEPAPETMAEPAPEPTQQPTGQAMIDQMAQEAARVGAVGSEPTIEPTEPTPSQYLKQDRFGQDYQPTEAAQRVRQELGVDEAEQAMVERGGIKEPSQQPTEPADQTIERIQREVEAESQRQYQRAADEEAAFGAAEAEQAAFDEAGEQATIEAVTDQTGQPETKRIEQDTVAQPRQKKEPQRVSEMTQAQQVEAAQREGKTFGTLDKKPDAPKPSDSPRLAKKKGAKLSRKLNAIYERISTQNPEEKPTQEAFGYRPNSAMADAFAKLQSTDQEPTPEQFNERVDQLVEDEVITEPEAKQLKKSIREVAYNVTGRTERMKQAVAKKRQERGGRSTTETGVPVDEVAGEYKSVSEVADQKPLPEPEDDYDVEEDLGPDFEEDYGMAEAEPEPAKTLEGAESLPDGYYKDNFPESPDGWEYEQATRSPESFKKQDGKTYAVSKESAGTYAIWSKSTESEQPSDTGLTEPVFDGLTGETLNDGRVPVYGHRTPDKVLRDQGFRSSNAFTEEKKSLPDNMDWAAVKGIRGVKGKYQYWYRLKKDEPTSDTMEGGKEYDWDDDVVRFNETTGRVQTRSSEGGKWRNMKFNWMDKFTEDTGVTIPDEYREAHRQPRRDKQEEKPAQPAKMSDVAEDQFAFTELVNGSLKDEGEKVNVGDDYKLSPEADKAYQERLIKDLPDRPKAKHLQPAYDKLASAVIKGVDVTFTKNQYGYSQRFKVDDYTISGDANQYGITASHLSVDGDTESATFPTTFSRMVQKEYQKTKTEDAPKAKELTGTVTDTGKTTLEYFNAVQDKQPSWNDGLTNEDYWPLGKANIVFDNKSEPAFTEVSTDSFKGQKTYKELRVATWVRMNKFMPEALKLVDDNFDSIKNAEPPYSDINGLYNSKLADKVGDGTGTYVLREAMEQHYKDIARDRSIKAQVKAKTDKVMKSAKQGELTRLFDRLGSGQVKPDQVVRGASGATHPRRAAFEWLYKEINNADPDNKVIERVGLGSNGKPFKSEIGARNQGKGQNASEVVPAGDIVAGEGGFVWVKYEDTTPDGTDTGPKGEATESVASEVTATPSAGKIKSATAMINDIADQLYTPGMTPADAELKVDSFFTTMGYSDYMATLPAYQNRKENVQTWKAQNRQLKNLREQKDEIIIALANKATQEAATDVSDTARDLERDSGDYTVDQEISPAERRKQLRKRDREVDEAVEQGRTTGRREPSLPPTSPLDAGTSNTDTVVEPDGKPSAEIGVTGSADTRGNDIPSGERVSVDEAAAEAEISRQTDDGTPELTRKEQQAAADKVAVIVNDAKNIEQTLPLLSPEQRDDVVAAEKRLYGDLMKGMMFTNGTGTGKTYTGCGVIKRVVQNGGKVLVVAPAGTIKGWQNAAKDLAFEMVKLKDKSTGAGDNQAVITSFQNFGDNQALLEDKFDLVVYDESHKLMANMQGDSTKAAAVHYAMTGTGNRGYLRYEKELDAVKQDIKDHVVAEKKAGREISEADAYQIPKFAKKLDAIRKKVDKFTKQHQRLEKKSPTKALFLSATPFSGHKSVFYADGYLFETNANAKQGGYNTGSPQDQFLVKNFGYRMKYNKPNRPGAEVDVGLLERDWADEMFESGAMVGRTLNLSQDYSRQFPQVEQGVGRLVDELYNTVNYKDYPKLSAELIKWRKGGMDRQLAEALRIRGTMDRIEDHLKLGRKVVVFHQRMEMKITDPFAGPLDADGQKEYQKLRKEHPRLASLDFTDLVAAPEAMVEQFGADRVGLFNGQVTKTRNADLKDFNKDGGKKDILVIQKDAGKEGLSAHDITGLSQRALIVTNTPQSPADAIQMEGRIYRFGLQSNAVVEYPTVQTNFEKVAFRDVVSNRTATAENLAMGSQARMLRTSFRDGYMQPYMQMPNDTQGTGGKSSDRTVGQTSQLDRAKTYYYKRQQKTQATKAAEGADYFATPEPIGLSMVNMAQILPGETALEPSAGHGAIAHWFPESANAVAIEQSPDLIGDLSMFTDADVRHQDFEDLNIINKFDAITMNPPFGKGGHLAIQHIDKATKHLNDGGRVVAIYPEGGLADKRFDKWYEDVEGIYLTGEIKLPGVTFKRAGTGVRTRILILDKDTSGKAVSQNKLNIDMGNETDPNKLFERIHELEAPKRPDVRIGERDVGMFFKDEGDKFSAKLNSYSSKGRDIGIRETDKIAQKYFGEKQVETDYFGDKDYTYEFDTDRDRQRFAKGVLEEWNRKYRRERKTETTSFKDADEIKFSKESATTPPPAKNLYTDALTVDRAQSVVNAIKREYNKNNDIDINVFEDKSGRYDEATLQFLPENHPADYHPRKVLPDGTMRKPQINIFVNPNRESAARLTNVRLQDRVREFGKQIQKSVRHELLGHYGLDTLGKDNKNALLSRIEQTRGKARFKDVWSYVDRVYDGDPQSVKNEEFFARFAEQYKQESDPLWLSILDNFTRALQKVGLLKGQLTRKEINDSIESIRKDIRSGKATAIDPESQVKYRKQSPEDVETIANDFIAQYQGLSNVNVMVLPNQAALAEITNTEPNATVKGAYMPNSDTVIMVAENIQNAEDARRVLRHELIAHKGLMETLSQNEVDALTSKVMGLQNAKSLADIWKTVNNSYKSAPDAIKAEEVIARIAESPKGAFGQVADQVIGWVMGAMRRVGLLSRDKVTVSEIRNMLNNVDKDLRNNSGRLNKRKLDTTMLSQVVDREPEVSIEAALQANDNAYLDTIKKTVARFGWDSLKENWMAGLTLRQMAELKDRVMGGRLGKYLDTVNQMLVVQNTLAEQVADRVDKVQKWANKNRPAADQLFTVMHNSTLANVDPSARFESMIDTLSQERADIDNRLRALIGTSGQANKRRAELINRGKEIEKEIKNEPARRMDHKRMKREFDKLTPEAQQHFKEMRDHYAEQRGRMQKTLLDNIEKAQVNEKAKAVMLRQLRFDMERAKKGLYFPLSRFGKYWIDTVDKPTGERYFMMYDTQAEMESAKRKLIKSGYKEGVEGDFTSGQRLQESRAMDGASMGFVSDVINELQSANVNQSAKDDLTDTVYQLYLQAMPERSIRRNFIHRKGVAGFNQDAIRAMADQGVKQSRQQARLQFADELEEQMTEMRDFADKSKDVEITRTTDEMTKRHEWVKNPSRGKAAQKLTSLGFYWMLGASPASALVNLTQTVQIGIGVLGSRHGNIKSTAAIGAATKDFTTALAEAWKNKGKKGVMYYGLSGHERAALEYGMDIGALDTTQAADLMGLAENPSATYSGRIEGVMKKVGFMFHYAEIMNREVTYMAAYRMEFAKNGGNADAAAKYAVQATWDSHFDYGSLNRARFMQGDLAAVALQFKQYSQSMTYFLASNAFKSIKGATPEERRTARRQITWTLGSTFLVAGLSATPLMSVIMGSINLANDAFGEEDEPWDAETEFKSMLTEYFGEDVSKQVWYGASPSISGRISLNDLWLRDPNRDLTPEQWGQNLVQNLLGPTLGGVGFQFLRGMGDVAEGNTLRGAESMMPKAVKDVIRTYRYLSEGGITNRQGDLLVEDLDIMELTGQVLGFVPSRSVYRYDQNSAMKGYEKAAIARRSGLLKAYYMAWRSKDAEAVRNVQDKIKAFNRSKWGRSNPIRSSNIKASIKRRQRNLMRSDSGLLVSPKLERLVNESAYWS